MPYDPAKHHRRSVRLKGHDYSESGAYVVTVCSEHHLSIFGEIVDERMRLNDVGEMVDQWWRELSDRFGTVGLDEYVVMPNHLHGIIIIGREEGGHVGPPLRTERGDDRVLGCGEGRHVALQENGATGGAQPRRGGPMCPPTNDAAGGIQSPSATRDANREVSLSRIVQWFKSMTTNDYVQRVKKDGWPPFPGRLWQRSYHDRVVRDGDELLAWRRYICNNPPNWETDPENLSTPRDDGPHGGTDRNREE